MGEVMSQKEINSEEMTKRWTDNHLLAEGDVSAARGMNLYECGQETAPPEEQQQFARTYKLEELIDLDKFQDMLDTLHDAVDLPSGILDCEGRILTTSGWQDICLSFHRCNPFTAKQCLGYDHIISGRLLDSEKPVIHHCPMGLVDSVVPLVIAGQHLGNVFIGQFLLEELDQERFREHAREYGFDEESYLRALAKVPVLSKKQLERNLKFIKKVAEILCETGLERLKNIENGQRLRTIFDSVSDAILVIDPNTGDILEVNDAMTAMFGYTSEEAGLLSLETLSLGDSPYSQAEAMHYVRGVEEGETTTIEWHAKRKDGSLFWCEINLRGALLVNKKIGLLTIRNITSRKEAEEQLHQREEEFRALSVSSGQEAAGMFSSLAGLLQKLQGNKVF